MNDELDVLEPAIPAAIDVLAVGGRIVVMATTRWRTDHQAAVRRARGPPPPPGFPVELEEHKPQLKTLTQGTETPTAQEIEENPRAASAKLRAVERIRNRS